MKQELKHTPGPWSVGHTRKTAMDHVEVLIQVGEYEKRGNVLATVCMGGPGALHSAEQSVSANARLISAAPELLAVVEAFTQWEADVIMDNRCWEPEGMATAPTLTPELWERLCDMQQARNEALSKVAGYNILMPPSND